MTTMQIYKSYMMHTFTGIQLLYTCDTHCCLPYALPSNKLWSLFLFYATFHLDTKSPSNYKIWDNIPDPQMEEPDNLKSILTLKRKCYVYWLAQICELVVWWVGVGNHKDWGWGS